MATQDIEKQPLLDPQTSPTVPEPTLAELQQNVFAAQRAYMRAWSRTTSGIWHRRIMFGVTALLLFFFAFCLTVVAFDDSTPPYHLYEKVPLEAHIMSKCPDARDCLHDMILPAMQNVSDKVDFRLSYIGSATDGSGAKCLHGQQECLGNILELCAANLYPPKISLGFTWCLTQSYEDIPSRSLVEDCALEHGISMSKLNDCTNDEDEGMEMLRASFERSEEAGVQTSCTIRLAGEVRCVRDGGKWKDCEEGSTAEELVRDILALREGSSI